MPIYEYQCLKCGHVFEVQQSFSDKPVTTCRADSCTGRVKKLFSPPAIIFKGSGFHVTDYGRKGGNGKPSSCAEKKRDSEAPCEAGKSCDPAACAAD